MIKIKNYDKEKQKLSFISDMSVSLANAIRRSVLEIPIMAIDEVEIIKNDSALYDEFLAHRIGLIPIKTDKTSKESVFKLRDTGPKTLKSSSIKPDIGIEVDIPIVILDKDQEVEINCYARLGKGIEHIKYSPGLAYYKHNIDEELLDFIEIDSEGRIKIDEEELKIKDLSEDKIKRIKDVKNVKDIEFNLESWGQIDVKDIFLKAIDVLESNLRELEKSVK